MRISQIAEQLFPFWNYCKYSKRLKKQCDVEVDPCAKELADYQKLPQEQLRQRLKEEHQRASAMDEKTFKLTFSLSVGLTVLGSTIAYLTQVIPSGMVQKFLIGGHRNWGLYGKLSKNSAKYIKPLAQNT